MWGVELNINAGEYVVRIAVFATFAEAQAWCTSLRDVVYRITYEGTG